jgi:hypothetical protein
VTPLHGDLAEVFVGGHLDAVADGVAVAVVVVERAVLDEHAAHVARSRDERAVVVVGRRLGRVNGHIADRAVGGGADGDAVAAAQRRAIAVEVERAVLDGDLVNVSGAGQRALIPNRSRSGRTARKTANSSTLGASGIGLQAQSSAAVVAGFNIGHLDIADIAVIGDVGDAVAVVVDLDGGTGSASAAKADAALGGIAGGLDGLDVGPGDLADVAGAHCGLINVSFQTIAAKPVLLADLVGEAEPADLLALGAQEDAEPKAKVGSAIAHTINIELLVEPAVLAVVVPGEGDALDAEAVNAHCT